MEFGCLIFIDLMYRRNQSHPFSVLTLQEQTANPPGFETLVLQVKLCAVRSSSELPDADMSHSRNYKKPRRKSWLIHHLISQISMVAMAS
ncbi:MULTISPECIES: hypothetical protein [Nostoc]|uniref:Uncharacterized protein n=1 Tax=Nostoc paludosum FACHB-159 TaxID=2692908 RepID=A0ABR8K5Z0_9NOSO|nr:MULTISPECIES: hypothetical protein [Nostoc]MBD2683249.1 hypothetical protein [Nostoc sp. FACHB-857]MBD2734886.1 hypothetical protein [Nostoc paludosum FACHB-159]